MHNKLVVIIFIFYKFIYRYLLINHIVKNNHLIRKNNNLLTCKYMVTNYVCQ